MYERERNELIDSIAKKGIDDVRVLDAMRKVERHKFIPEAINFDYYMDKALPIGYGQTISQPYTVAYMTQALRLKDSSKVLEIGTGSGYQAAVLYQMGMQVFSIERNFEIYNRVLKLFDKLGIRVHTKWGDGTIGWREYAPYDGIIVTAGSPNIPVSLKKQLAVGARLVIPVGDRKTQILKIITRIDDGDNFEIVDVPTFSFVPLVGREGWSQK